MAIRVLWFQLGLGPRNRKLAKVPLLIYVSTKLCFPFIDYTIRSSSQLFFEPFCGFCEFFLSREEDKTTALISKEPPKSMNISKKKAQLAHNQIEANRFSEDLSYSSYFHYHHRFVENLHQASVDIELKGGSSWHSGCICMPNYGYIRTEFVVPYGKQAKSLDGESQKASLSPAVRVSFNDKHRIIKVQNNIIHTCIRRCNYSELMTEFRSGGAETFSLPSSISITFFIVGLSEGSS
ncbi:hypothetical protein G4B88_000307 [Cannabis sativa]|uniref:Uncharacterized protein n=1 Tax=Cannabis sativa TaxID=3483 RepID=A0A7J6DVK2_CANSA|nr:hypothetical protein G4B88_000307 [Cannabis sativa]